MLNKVFPDHWSFMLGEIALYSFIVLLLTGTFLALFFDPSMAEITYNGSYTPLRGIEMTKAYETSLNISFDVRGGLIMRQMHHWAALLFMAAIVVHMFRMFFTGAFRKPRELNWIIGVGLFWLGFTEGFAGYSLPDDALSGTGLRIASAIMLSIPVAGSWVTTSLFGGEFPGTEILPRLYIVHVLLVPAILLALIVVHVGLVFKQKHSQWPGPGRTNQNVVGVRMFPQFAASGAAVHDGVRGRGAHGRPAPDQPDLALRAVRGGRRLGRRASPTGTSCSSTARPVSCRPGTSPYPSVTGTSSRRCSGRPWCCQAS